MAMPAVNWATDPPAILRTNYAAARATLADDFPAAAEVFHLNLDGVTGLRFVPNGGGAGAPIVFFHGGGWVVGSPDTHRVLCGHLAVQARREVLSMRYRLAPEHPFPAQPEDAIAALSAVLEEVPSCFVAGDSAGAAMALWAESGVPVPDRARILGVGAFYGAFGVIDSASLRRANTPADGPGLADAASFYRHLGLDDPVHVRDWIAGTGAPVFLLAAERDSLLDDSRILANELPRRDLTLVTARDQPHAFLHAVGRDTRAMAELHRFAAWCAALEPS